MVGIGVGEAIGGDVGAHVGSPALPPPQAMKGVGVGVGGFC